MMAVNRVFLSEFIKLYRDHTELWKINSEEYKNKCLKKRAYLVLQNKFLEVNYNATVDDVKRKINTLRSNYRRELHKVYRSGSGPDGAYVPSLWYFNELDFLRDQTTALEERYMLDSDQEENSVSYKAKLKPKLSRSRGRKRKVPAEKGRNVLFKKALGYLEGANDDAEIFGKSWAAEYRKLTPDQQLYAKKQIDDILYKGRLGRLRERSTENNYPFQSLKLFNPASDEASLLSS